jgi:heptaprenyl diphosphate synthase
MESRARTARIALYGALAVGLYTVENLIPSPLPWLRVGASNAALLLALFELGPGAAGAVFLLKLLLGSLLVGRFLTPFFWFALAGGSASLGLMVLARWLGRKVLGVVGVSIIGGVGHSLAQLGVARLMILPSDAAWVLVPVLVLVGTVSGLVVGLLAQAVLRRLKGA